MKRQMSNIMSAKYHEVNESILVPIITNNNTVQSRHSLVKL